MITSQDCKIFSWSDKSDGMWHAEGIQHSISPGLKVPDPLGRRMWISEEMFWGTPCPVDKSTRIPLCSGTHPGFIVTCLEQALCL